MCDAQKGWRIGWCVVPPALESAISALAQNLFISPVRAVQRMACVVALRCFL
jgi:aspartate/methionine/tyrosine aminotransferase